MIEITRVQPKEVAPIIRVCVDEQYEHQYEESFYEFFRTEDEMKKWREDFEKSHKQPDGSWINGLDYADFEEELVTFEEAKEDMTVAQFEALYGVKVEDLL